MRDTDGIVTAAPSLPTRSHYQDLCQGPFQASQFSSFGFLFFGDRCQLDLNDDSIDVVVELVGGTTFAKTVVLEGIKRGKSVVTANKELIAKHVTEMCTDPCH